MRHSKMEVQIQDQSLREHIAHLGQEKEGETTEELDVLTGGADTRGRETYD